MKKEIQLSAESTIDLPQEDLEAWDIKILHFHLEKEGKTYFDKEMTLPEMFEFTEKTGIMCRTAAPNIDEEERHFSSLLENADHIIHFTISSGISSGYNNAVVAAHENPNITVIDSHGTAGAIALLAFYARDLINAGYHYEDVVKMVMARRDFLQCSFVIDKLNYLYKGGRCSRLAMLGANLLRIRPEIICDPEGKFAIGKKHRGPTVKCIREYVENMLAAYPNIDKKRVFFTQSTAPEGVKEMCIQIAKDFGFEEIRYTQASPTNGYHAGPNVVGIHFFYDGPHDVVPQK